MKYIKKLFIIGLICILLPFNVFAETVKNDNGYEFEITKIEKPSCVATDEYTFLYKVYEDGSVMYITYSEDYLSIDSYTFVTTDGTCQAATNQQILDLDSVTKTKYQVKANSNNKLEIYEVTQYNYKESFVLTTDTELDDSKLYYVADTTTDGDGNTSVSAMYAEYSPLVENISTYYEKMLYVRPSTTEIDSTKTYYSGDGFTLTKVENPTTENILDYYIEYTGATEDSKKLIDTISDAKFAPLAISAGEENFGVKVLGKTNKYQYIVQNAVESDDGAISIDYDIYDKDANKLFSGLDDYESINDALFITYKNGKAVFYGRDLKELYTIEEDVIGLGVGYSTEEDIAYLSTNLSYYYKIELKNVPDITYSISNPGTSDEIIISAIIGFISLIGLYKVTKFIRRKTRLC